MKRKKNKNRVIVPVYETHPISGAEKGDERTLEDAVEMAKKWVDEHKL